MSKNNDNVPSSRIEEKTYTIDEMVRNNVKMDGNTTYLEAYTKSYKQLCKLYSIDDKGYMMFKGQSDIITQTTFKA